MNVQRIRALATITTLALAAAPLAADGATATLRRGLAEPAFYPGGYSGVSDNTLFYYSAGPSHPAFPNIWMRASDGGNNKVRAINASTSERNLWRFDLSGMSGQSVEVTSDATLTLTSAGGAGVGNSYFLYQIAAANAGWVESTNNAGLNPTSPASGVQANNGDPTWFYKSINATLPITSSIEDDANSATPSVTWASGQVGRSAVDGSNPEGYANTGGLWNWIDLVDQDPETVADTYLTMFNMDPVASAATTAIDTQVTFTLPKALIQSWIDDPASNAGLLGRFSATQLVDFYSSEFGTAGSRPTLNFDYEVNAAIPGDFNGDQVVNGSDFTEWTGRFGDDLAGEDFLTWQRNFAPTSVAVGTSVPESATAGLALCGFALLAPRRRRAARKAAGRCSVGK